MPRTRWPRLVPAGPGHPEVRRYFDIRRGSSSGDEAAIEGLWFLRRASEAAAALRAVFVCPPLLRGEEAIRFVEAVPDAARLEVSERLLRRMVSRDGPDGVAAIAHLPRHDLSRFVVPTPARLLIADRMEQAGNLGATIRCADGAGASAVLLTDRRLRRNDPRVVRGSMGSVFSIPVVEADPCAAMTWLRANDVRLIAADPAGAISYREASYAGRVAFVVGSERHGLSEPWRREADALVRIPMLGHADSLNVGHAAAVLLYEAAHQQGEK